MTEIYRLRVFYEKTGPAIFVSGRNMLKIIERTFRRIEAPLKFTEGFSPHPKISFGHPLPLNISGFNESFDVFLCEKPDLSEIMKKTQKILPEGIIFRSARWIDRNAPSITGAETLAEYTLETERGIDLENDARNIKILKQEKNMVKLLIKINNYSHKKLTGLLLDGSVKSISRKICDEKLQTADK